MADTINITATSADGVLLHTEGKFIEKDIKVTFPESTGDGTNTSYLNYNAENDNVIEIIATSANGVLLHTEGKLIDKDIKVTFPDGVGSGDNPDDDNGDDNNGGNSGGGLGGWGAETYFFINDNYYTFLEGMTWADWTASEYNTDDYRISYNWLTDDGGIELPTRDEENLTVTNIFKISVCRGGVRVDPSDTIIAEEVYELDENETEVITFTVDDTEYTATMGMTWGEWLTSGYNKDYESLEYIYFKPLRNVEFDGEQFDLVICYVGEENRWIENPYGTTMWLSDVPLIEDSACYTSQYVDYEVSE